MSVATSSVTVRPVAKKRDLKAFIDLPFRLHAGTKWVPPLKLERRILLAKKGPFQNAFFTHGDAEYFLAERDGKVVGRISAQVDHNFNEYQQSKWGSFGFVEFEDDQEILDALLTAAGDWIREQGMERMVGPIDLHINNEAGLLVEGYEKDPIILQPWHPEYYKARFEEAGLTKAMDLLMWSLVIDDKDKVHPAIFEAAAKAETEHGLRIEKMTRRSLSADYKGPFRELFNAAWSKNWGYSPYTEADIKALGEESQLAYTKEWMMKAVDQDDNVVGMAITIPDLNQVLAKMKGKLFPFGWWHFAFGRKKITRIRVGFLGVQPDRQHTGAAALLYREHFDAAHRTPVRTGEMGWILETNKAMNWAMQGMNGKLSKRYRIYDRPLVEGVEPLPEPIPWDAA
ncbi:MAG: hypothetical protein J7513_01930 [Solirubrobacteraceae bacterium]|nr:hypothetical protein [Solirubrobacteraceae bacterium]